LFETRVDGVVSAELGLQGKPHGDIFVKAAQNMECNPKNSVVIEDAVAGVQAGKAGGFGLVVGVAREGNVEDLKQSGADVVVEDFEGVLTEQLEEWFEEVSKKGGVA
jgi:beta-phosphoglucomutase-like phosphatase (HAD superfamily)